MAKKQWQYCKKYKGRFIILKEDNCVMEKNIAAICDSISLNQVISIWDKSLFCHKKGWRPILWHVNVPDIMDSIIILSRSKVPQPFYYNSSGQFSAQSLSYTHAPLKNNNMKMLVILWTMPEWRFIRISYCHLTGSIIAVEVIIQLCPERKKRRWQL